MGQRSYSTILFDLDGTLIDSVPVIVSLLQAFFAEYGGSAKTAAQIKDILGPPEEQILAARFGHKPAAEFAARYREFLRTQAASRSAPQLPEMMAALRRHGIPIGVITNKSAGLAEQSLQALRVEKFVDTLVAGDMGIPLKPAPDGVRHALRQLNGSAATALLVGDTLADKGAAGSSGVTFMHALWFASRSSCGQCDQDCDDFSQFAHHILDHIAGFSDESGDRGKMRSDGNLVG